LIDIDIDIENETRSSAMAEGQRDVCVSV